MSKSDFVYAVHNETKVISSIPRIYLEMFDFYTELSDADIAEVRKREEARIHGRETVEPSPSWRKAELLEFAETHGVDVEPTATKADVLEAISAQEGVK